MRTIVVAGLVIFLVAGCGGGSEENGGTTGGSLNASFDANGDGRADILIETASDSLPWRFGLSTGNQFDTSSTLTQIFDPASFKSARAIAVADANGDGNDDVLVQLDTVGDSTQWQVHLSSGSTSSQSMGGVSLPSGDDPRALAFTDIDGDGLADLLLQRQFAGFIEWYVSLGNGIAFAVPELVYTFATDQGRAELIALEDVNADGSADLVFDWAPRGSHCYFVRLFRAGAFESQPLSNQCLQMETDFDTVEPSPDGIGEGGVQAIQRTQAAGIADMNGDGRAELVISTTINTLETFRISSTPGSVQFITQGEGVTSWFMLGFAAGASGTEWQDNAQAIGSESVFTTSSLRASREPATTVDLVDLNNDGRVDVLYQISLLDRAEKTRDITIKALVSRSDGSFAQQEWLDFARHSLDVDIGLGDFDGDGRLDLAISSWSTNSALQQLAAAIIYANNGSAFVQNNGRFSSYLRFDVPGRVRFLLRDPDNLTSVAHDTGALIAWAGILDTRLYTHNEFQNLLGNKGYDLKAESDTGPIQPGECRAVYASADRDDLAVEFGTMVCLDIDGLTLRQQYIYGGCDLANQGGLGGTGGQCEIGTFRTDIGVNIGGVDQNLGVEGPAARVCGALSLEVSCVRAGAQVASLSGKTMVGNTGVGAGVSIGLGGGATFGTEDGVLSGAIDLEVGIGVTIEFSIDYEATGEFAIRHGETAYVFVRDDVGETVISAGSAVIDAVNVINDSGAIVVEGVGQGITFVGNQVTAIGDQVVDLIDDGIDVISDFFGL